MAAHVRSQLEKTAGLSPSDDWLTACQAHLRLTNEESPDAVLHQVLYADLRDVVRPTLVDGIITGSSSAASLLRNALQESMRSETRKAVLQSTFALMVQVEELLDVSLNADARYAIGPASSSNPTPVGNQKARCLKLYLSDGHLPPIHLIGMEMAPIPNLSVNSLAGIKVLLKGALVIRHGMVQLNPGCATVLGGSVADLVVVQKKALEQAQRLAGIGVDPTVKALIWNKDDALESQQEEEGEASSGDVTAVPRALPVQQSQQQQQQQANARIAVQRPQQQSTTRIIPQQPPPQRSSVPPRHNTAPPIQQYPTAQVPPQQRQQIWSSNGAEQPPRQPSAPITRTQQQIVAAVSQTPSSHRNITVVSQSSSRSINPYARNSSASSHVAVTKPAPVVVAIATLPECSSSTDASHSSNPKENRPSNLPAVRAPPSSAATTTSSTKSMTTQSSQESSCSVAGMKEPLSFDELMALVKRIVRDRPLYEQHMDKVFVVPAKMKGAHTYFNIEKKKKKKSAKKSKGGEKYEYVMNSHFTGPVARTQLITVVVAGDILRPHFELPPGEMRKLSRENRQASQKLVGDGGRSAMLELSTLRSWEITLYASSEIFFGNLPSKLDGEVPILRVLRQSD